MLVDNYKVLAEIYNHLMYEVNYEAWAKYIYLIYVKNVKKKENILELASGCGNVSMHFGKNVKNLFITDKSFEMLKNTEPKNYFNKVCCNMLWLPFKNKFNFIYSTFDSINYLLDFETLQVFFERIQNYIEKGGIFTFDVSLEKNSYIAEKILNREGVYNGYFYSQQSKYDKKKRIHENTFSIISPDGKNYEEIHLQRIYDIEDYFRAISKTNLYVKECYNAFTFDDFTSESERVQFILKKR